MRGKILFTEQQKFKQWWLWVLLIGINGIFIFKLIRQITYNQRFSEYATNDTESIFSFIIIFIITGLFYFFKLETIIKNDGIYVRFFPIQIAYKKYSWENISKCYIRKYSSLSEYGGWGYRIGIFGKGNALNVSGDEGLQLEIFNKPNLLIGTNKPEELKDVLIKLNKYKD